MKIPKFKPEQKEVWYWPEKDALFVWVKTQITKSLMPTNLFIYSSVEWAQTHNEFNEFDEPIFEVGCRPKDFGMIYICNL